MNLKCSSVGRTPNVFSVIIPGFDKMVTEGLSDIPDVEVQVAIDWSVIIPDLSGLEHIFFSVIVADKDDVVALVLLVTMPELEVCNKQRKNIENMHINYYSPHW